jgi:hypothetical protein
MDRRTGFGLVCCFEEAYRCIKVYAMTYYLERILLGTSVLALVAHGVDCGEAIQWSYQEAKPRDGPCNSESCCKLSCPEKYHFIF